MLALCASTLGLVPSPSRRIPVLRAPDHAHLAVASGGGCPSKGTAHVPCLLKSTQAMGFFSMGHERSRSVEPHVRRGHEARYPLRFSGTVCTLQGPRVLGAGWRRGGAAPGTCAARGSLVDTSARVAPRDRARSGFEHTNYALFSTDFHKVLNRFFNTTSRQFPHEGATQGTAQPSYQPTPDRRPRSTGSL